MPSILLFGKDIVFHSLFASVHLQGGGIGSKEDLFKLADSLEASAYCLEGGSGIERRSKEVIYSTLSEYLGRNLGSDKRCAIELQIIVDDLRNTRLLDESGTRDLARFCYVFHEYSIGMRDRTIPEVERITGPLS